MKRVGAFLATFAFVGQLQLYTTAQQPQAAQQQPPPTASGTVGPPTFNVGDSWEYRRPNQPEARAQLKLTVTEIKGDLVTMVNRAGHRFVFTKEGNIVEGQDVGRLAEKYDPSVPRLQFPLQEGKAWIGQYTVRQEREPQPINVTLRAKVGGWERVSVPAGTFDAIRIQISIERVPTGPRKAVGAGHGELCWYAQEVKRFVKCSYSEHVKGSDFELVSYQVK